MFPTMRGMSEYLALRLSRSCTPPAAWAKHPAARLPALLCALASSPSLPDWTSAQWVAILRAPQASRRVPRSDAERAMAGAAVIERPEVARLLAWVHSTWPGSLEAMAGALAAARRVQDTRPTDLDAASTYVLDEIRRARSRRGRRSTTRSRVVPVDPAKLRAVEPAPTPPAAPSHIADALTWMVGFTGVGMLPQATRLSIEAGMELFVAWYLDRVPHRLEPPLTLVAIPPSRALPPKQRLSVRVADRELLLLLGGPPGSRACPTERAWRRGMGHWTLVVLASWAQGAEPPAPPPEAVAWWSQHLELLVSHSPQFGASAAVASQAPAPEAVSQAM